MLIITYNGKLHVFYETEHDALFPEECFTTRCWFIVKNMESYKNNISYLDTLSHIWINISVLGVEYDNSIMDEIQHCITV